MTSIAFKELSEATSAALRRIPVGERAEVTHHGRVVGTVYRPKPFAADWPDLPAVQISDMQRDRGERVEALDRGEAFVLRNRDRRLAVIEGVKA